VPPREESARREWYLDAPPIFTKPTASLAGCRDDVAKPCESSMLDYEAEIAIVVGRQGRNIPASMAGGYIAGFMAVNDVTAHDVMLTTSDLAARTTRPAMQAQFFVGKGYDTFLPCGPWIATLDLAAASQLTIRTEVNGEVRQYGSSADMALSYVEIVEMISRFATVRPGDLILTGTPPGTGLEHDPPRFLECGDVIRVCVDPGLGSLTKVVVAESVSAGLGGSRA
jgi:2-keto-4-pentenoate hydratase/2-oxohepta-3-ene-1,7-dioic acid hydratase in catechol pathway